MDMAEEHQFEPDYEDFINPHDTFIAKNRNVKGSECNLCHIKVKHPQTHSFSHFPFQFNPKQQKDQDPFPVVINSLLGLATIFKVNSIYALHSYVVENNLYPTTPVKLNQPSVTFFDNLSSHLQVPIVQYSLNPPNSIALIAHWKILQSLLALITPSERLIFVEHSIFNFNVDSPYISDSHFHLDQLLRRRNCDEYYETLKYGVPVALAINNVCFYKLPTLNEMESIHGSDSRIYFTIGAHPRFPNNVSEYFLTKVNELASNPLVVGIGEIGIDSTGDFNWSDQSDLLLKMVNIAVNHKKTLVIHCREPKGENTQFVNLLSSLDVPKFHSIHLHCFSYNVEMMNLWLDKFPNTAFGITSIIFKNLEQYTSLLEKINLHQILVESDAPYLDRTKSSMCIPEIVDHLSKLRSIPIKLLYTTILENTRRVYNIEQ